MTDPYRTPGEVRVEAPFDALRTIEDLSVRVVGLVPLGRVSLGLAGLRYSRTGREASLEDGFQGLRLPFGSTVIAPDGRRPQHTLEMLRLIAASPGFAGQLDRQRHPERFLHDAAKRSWSEGEGIYEGGFAVLGAERLVFLGGGQLSWAAAVGEPIRDLAFMDSRPELLRGAMQWLVEPAIDAALARFTSTGLAVSYSADEVRRARANGHGMLSLGLEGEELDLRLTPDERGWLEAWVTAGASRATARSP